MDKITFAEAIYLAFKGELPSKEIGQLINAMLVSSIDHGVTPPSVLTTRTIASTGAPLNSAIAGGILAISRWHGGAIEMCMLHLLATKEIMDEENLKAEVAAKKIVTVYREQKKKLSGFGHRVHSNDPRAAKLFSLAKKAGLAGTYLTIAKAIGDAIEMVLGRKLPLNVDGAIAAVLCELDFPPEIANAFFIMARVPGLAVQAFEEQVGQRPMRKIHPTDHSYHGPDDRDFL